MSLQPQWSERLSKTGRPEQPLRAYTVSIRMEQTIARGITTDVRARGRYFSAFCWALDRIFNSSSTSHHSQSEKEDLLEGFEEILGLASYRRQETRTEHKDGLSGITGSSNISDDSLYDGETIDLSSFRLLNNSPYGVRRFQSTLGNFYLKQGQYELTATGRALAESLGEIVDPYFEQMISAVKQGEVPLSLLDDLSDAFTHQGCFTSQENNGEQDTLQRILFGIVDWDERDQTVKLAEWPDRLDIPIDEHCQYMLADEHYTNSLQDSVVSRIHYLRRAWCLAILRAHQILATNDTESDFEYDEADTERFQPFRSLGRIYYLQVQVAHALRAQLWGLTAHLKREAPGGVPKTELLNQLESLPIAAEADATLRSETTLGSERLSSGAITRELFLSGRVTPQTYEITVPDADRSRYETMAELRGWLQSNLAGTWRPTTDSEINGLTLMEATENAFEAVKSATTRTEATRALGCLLARSTVQLLAAVEQYQQVTGNEDRLKRYVEQRFGSRQSSLVMTTRYLEQLNSDMPLATVTRRLFDERVITIHDYVVQDRLGSGSISLAFGTGADAGDQSANDANTLFAAGGTGQPSKQNLRYRDLRRLMRDVGLLTYQADTDLWVPTADGKTVINRFRGGSQ